MSNKDDMFVELMKELSFLMEQEKLDHSTSSGTLNAGYTKR